METNIPVEQAVINNGKFKRSNFIKGKDDKSDANDIEKSLISKGDKSEDNLAELNNGIMMSTSEILDFAAGIDSTEYGHP